MTQDGTRQGMILGTPAYMSPEQARGAPVDKRTDIWAFGCVLYEMLTGRAAFGGDTITDTLARVLEREPDWDGLPADVPASIRSLLRRCLRKDPRHRLHDIADARIEIDDRDLAAAASSGLLTAPSPVVARGRHPNRLPWITAALVGLALVGALGVGLVYLRQPPPADLITFTIAPPAQSTFNSLNGAPMSPDGRTVAFIASGKLWVRPLASLTSQPLPGTEGARAPFWSPDSQSLGFFAGAKLKKVAVSGGSPVEVCDAIGVGGGTWNGENIIVFGSGVGPLQKVSFSGGPSTPVATMGKDETGHWSPWFLPDGQHFLYLSVSGDRHELRIRIIGVSRYHVARTF